jgi:DNA-binding CsgD family transcriptional regulator
MTRTGLTGRCSRWAGAPGLAISSLVERQDEFKPPGEGAWRLVRVVEPSGDHLAGQVQLHPRVRLRSHSSILREHMPASQRGATLFFGVTMSSVSATAAPLLDREAELQRIDALLAGTEAGSSGVLVIEGGAGMGKTSLVAACSSRASQRDVLLLGARGRELEDGLGFGVVRQLSGPYLASASRARQDALFAGAARLASWILSPEREGPKLEPLAAMHALYWFLAGVAADRPVVLAVDDAHWADEESLRWIAYAVGGLEGLAVGLLVATRPVDPGGGSPLAEVAAEGLAHVLRLGPLGQRSVGVLVRDEFDTAPAPVFVAACAEATGGNPFALRELLRDLRADGVGPTAESCERLVSHAPDRLARVALVRLARLGAESVAMARALAVLGGEAELALVASLAELHIAAAALAADSLVRADFLADERPLRFVHPLLRAAVYDDIPRGRRGLEHARAAALLQHGGAAAEEIAAHLLLTEPGDGESLRWLREAARSALARGAPGGAVAYLRRALREAMTPGLRAELLHELGTAETVGRDPKAATDLQEALALSRDPSMRARIAAELAEILILGAQWDAGMELLRTALSEVDERDVETRARLLALLIWARLIGGGVGDDSRADEQLARALAGRAVVNGRALSLVLAMTLVGRMENLDQVVGLVERAIESDDLVEQEGSFGLVLPTGVAALVSVDELDRAQALVERMLDVARRHNSVLGFGSGTTYRTWLSVRRGDLASAEDDLRTAIELATQHGLWLGVLVALHYGLEALIERPQLADLAALPEQIELPGALDSTFFEIWLLEVRGRLRLLRHDVESGIDDLRRSVEILNKLGWRSPITETGRVSLALALPRSDRGEALRLAEEELELANKSGLPRARGVALRTVGLLEGGARGIELLRESLALLEATPSRLEQARTLVELGAALRRDQQRAAAREPLRVGLDLAQRCGAERLANRAEEDLRATGARPRRRELSGRDALTASERRVVRMAAQGLSNPEIAQSLFVTIKTVEMHLGHAYRKLDVGSRAELAGVLETNQSGA